LGPHYRGKKFENNVQNFVTEIGSQAAITKVPDNGFDITVTFDRINVVMQLKYHYISSGKKVSIKVNDVRAFVGAFETQYRNSDFYGIFLTNSGVTFTHFTVTFDNSLVSMEAMGIENMILEFNNIKVQYQNMGNHVINFNNRKNSRVVRNSSKSESIPRYIIALFSVDCSINKGIEILKTYFVPDIDQLELFYSSKKTDEQNIFIYYLNEYEISCLRRNVLDLNIVTKDQFFPKNKSNALSKKKL
ncbi:28790_t:CDS:2, partial [Gigaspora margarita]